MSSVRMPPGLSNGTAARGSPHFLIPDLCSPLAVFGVVLSSQLLALLLTLAGQSGWHEFYSRLSQTALLLLWMGLISAAVLCRLRSWLTRLPVATGSVIAYLLVMACVAAVSEGAFSLGHFLEAGQVPASGWFPAARWPFLTRNLAIATLVMGPLLRYFYVSQQWQHNVRREAEARLAALQARIRPHFLFNSMNTIAYLTRSNPAAAEQAVEDLSDLFRASLRDGRQLIPLDEEINIAKVYGRMEQHRLGDRLTVDWRLGDLPGNALIPGLTIQPLLENAIFHGIEPSAEPGTITVDGTVADGMVRIAITNPVTGTDGSARAGHGLALDNIRERLELAFGKGATLAVEPGPDRYTVTIAFPAASVAAAGGTTG